MAKLVKIIRGISNPICLSAGCGLAALLYSAFLLPALALGQSVDDSAFSAFRDDVYPALRMHCAQCHSSEAIFPHGPDHSDGNAMTAFSTFRRFIDYSNPDNSRILQQLRNEHFCKDHGVHCGNEMKIQADLEPKILTWIARTMPKDLPDPDATAEFTVPDRNEFDAHFQLNPPMGVAARDLTLHLKFVSYQGNAFTLRQTEAEASAGTVQISGLRLLINGKAPTAQTGLELIDATGTFDVWAGAAGRKVRLVLTNSKPLIALKPGDRISLKYHLAPAAENPCQAPKAFESVIAPMLRNGAFGEANWSGLSTREINAVFATDHKPQLLGRLCQAFEQRINWRQPSQSVIFADMTTNPDSIFQIVKSWKKLGEILGRQLEMLKVRDVVLSRGDNYGGAFSNGSSACAITLEGELYCWGEIGANKIPLSYDRAATAAARVKFDEPVIQVVMSVKHICALTASRQVWCWGGNYISQAGSIHAFPDDSVTRNINIASPIHLTAFDNIGGSHVKKLVVSNHSTCALTDSGKVYCWGWNQSGLLGIEKETVEVMPPTQGRTSSEWLPNGIPLPERMIDISGGYYHHCAVSESKKLYCWGMAAYGLAGNELPIPSRGGIGSLPKSISNILPALVPGPVDKITSGAYHNCALSDGRLFCFGYGGGAELGLERNVAQLGANRGEMATSKVPFPGLATDVEAGSGYTCATSAEKALYCWGSGQMAAYLNYEDQSLIPTALQVPIGSTPNSIARAKIAWSDKVKKFAVGLGKVCAINQEDELHCWGNLTDVTDAGVDLQLFNAFKGKGIDLGFYTKVLLVK